MIGILCNKKREKFIVRRLHALFHPLIKDNDMPIVVFTLQGLDLQQKMITGWVISSKKPSAVKTKLPAVIFNLAVQFSRSEIKNVRGLMEIEEVSLLNIANRFNQWSIMEMLSSDNSLKKYVLPYVDLNDKNDGENFSENQIYILKPLKGSNLRKIIYGKQSDSVSMQNDESAKGQMKSALLIKTPELMFYNNRPCITRIYAQRNYNRGWKVLSRLLIPQNECVCDDADNMLNKASIQIVGYINRFIPDMLFCHVDFVIDRKGNPYLLGFGGWDNKIITRIQFRGIREKVCKNMLEYAQAFLNRPIEGGDYVD